MRIVSCDPSFSDQILAIFNDAIVTSTVLYDYKPRTMEMMGAWFDAKEKGKYPVIGAVTPDGELMGFGSYGTFRAWPSYKYTVEHSLYVATKFRGQGLGKRLLQELIAAAQAQDYHTLIGVIDSSNEVSSGLHRKMGFSPAGTLRQAGFKFGRWLDVDFYQLILSTPHEPKDG